ncbi:MAG: alpha/beta hydrolase [Lysinibacillus sp.]|nr:alpha/beta hydrolase [Lysinibacillus sp.]
MPIHLYIEQYFQQHPAARKTGIGVKNPPLEKRPKVFHIENKLVNVGNTQVPIRIYTPNEDKNHPLFIFFHGGNFIPGGLESHDVSCRMISSVTGYKVIAVDYCSKGTDEKLMLNHCYFVTNWIIENVKQLGGLSDHIAIGGPSVGAHFATTIVLDFIMKGKFPFFKQILHYPILQFDHDVRNSPHISRALFNGKYGIDLTLHPLDLSNLKNASLSYYAPLYAKKEHLAKMPKTLIFIAEYDPLFDEGELYAEKLKKAGVEVKLVRFDGNIHGFLQNFPGSPDYMRGYDITAEFLMNGIPQFVT